MVDAGKTFDVTVSLPTGTDTRVSAGTPATATVTLVEGPVVTLAVTDAMLTEGERTAVTAMASPTHPDGFTVMLSAPVSDRYRFVGTPELVFAADQASPTAPATLEAVQNEVDDGDVADVALTGTTSAMVRIVAASFSVLDDDDPRVGIASPTAAVGGFMYESEAGSATDTADDGSGAWTLTRAGLTDAALTVTVEVGETGGGDFVSAADEGSRTVTFAANETTARVYAVTDDAVDEPHNRVTATVVAGTGYAVAPAPGNAAAIGVRDDDAASGAGLVTVTVDPAADSVREGSEAVVEAVATAVDDGTFDGADDLARLFGGTGFGLTASTADGTATAPADYAALAAAAVTVPWDGFEASGGAPVARVALPGVATVSEDPAVEDAGETFEIAIARATGTDARIVLGTPAKAAMTIDEGPADGKLRLCDADYRCVHEDGTLEQCDADGVCEESTQTVDVPVEGRVEMAWDGVWGTVCDDNWSNGDVAVACRQLGHAGGSDVLRRAPFGGAARGVPIWLDDMACVGDEARLLDCRAGGRDAPVVGRHEGVGRHNCSTRHTEDAGVRCVAEEADDGYVVFIVDGREHAREHAVEAPAGSTLRYALRLSKEAMHLGGLDVEMRSSVAPADAGATVAPELFLWTPDQWSVRIDIAVTIPAGAAGRTLEVAHAVTRGNSNYDDEYQDGTMTVTVTAPASSAPPAHAPASVAADGDIALAGGEAAWEGRVELYRDGAWRALCASAFSLKDAEVACRQAGHGPALQALGGGPFGTAPGAAPLDAGGCAGTEARLADCPAAAVAGSGCGTAGAAGAVCTPAEAPSGAPRLVRAAAEGDRVTLVFDAAVDAAFAPAAADFEVRSTAGGAALRHAVDAVRVAGRRLTLAVAPPVQPGAAVAASYLRPARHPLRGAVTGIEAAAFDEVAVANRTAPEPAGGPYADTDAAWPGALEPGIEAAVRAALRGRGRPETLVRLDASRRGIADLAGVEALVALEELNLAGNAVEDLEPLAGLARLRVLDLAGNRVADLWPLSRAGGLERLILAGNRIADAAARSGGLRTLRVLDLSANALDDAWPLTSLGGLEYLSVAGNRIWDAGPLAGLPALVRLDLGGNAVIDVAALAALDRLVWLRVSGNRLSSLETLGRLTRLRWVLAADNPLVPGAAGGLPARVRLDLGADR